MIQIVLGFLFMVLSVCFITAGIKEQCDIKNYVLKSDIKDAFKDIDWSKQKFIANGVIIKDNNGNETFYPSEEIDKGIEKLNEKL